MKENGSTDLSDLYEMVFKSNNEMFLLTSFKIIAIIMEKIIMPETFNIISQTTP